MCDIGECGVCDSVCPGGGKVGIHGHAPVWLRWYTDTGDTGRQVSGVHPNYPLIATLIPEHIASWRISSNRHPSFFAPFSQIAVALEVSLKTSQVRTIATPGLTITFWM